MQHVINIRKSTGLGQQSMAAFLGLTRQALDKVEKNLCSFSTANLIKLSRLQACLDGLPDADGNNQCNTQLSGRDESENLQRREADCRYFAAVTQKELSIREASFKKSMLLFEALNILQPTDEGDELWIKKTKNETINKLDNCGPAVCMRLRKRVYLLTAEADYIHQFVNENNIHL